MTGPEDSPGHFKHTLKQMFKKRKHKNYKKEIAAGGTVLGGGERIFYIILE